MDQNYEAIVSTMFECLQQMAKMEGGANSAEDKDQLNYHVVLIGEAFSFRQSSHADELPFIS